MSVKVRGSLTIKDKDNIEASTFVYALADDAATAAAIEADLKALALLADQVTSGQITQLRATIFPALPPTNSTSTATQIKDAPVSGSEIERGGLFTFPAVDSLKHWSFLLPALSHAAGVRANGKIVVGGTAPAQLFADAFATGGTVLAYTNDNSQDLEALSGTKIVTRKHRKQRGKSSQT